MIDDLAAAAMRLAAVLEQENAALAALDLQSIGALLPEKRAATAAFAAARNAAEGEPKAERLRPSAARLAALGAENRRLLERAMTVQTRIMGLVAQALPVTAAPNYCAGGAPRPARSPIAFALSARA